MVNVIETNLSLDDDGVIRDHQSRVIEVESWEDFIDEIESGEKVYRKSVLGGMYGASMPRECRIENFVYDEHHLSCDIINFLGMRDKKLAFLIGKF